MEHAIPQFDSTLSLTEDEAVGVVIPQAAWDRGSSAYRLTLVGRLLSHRTVLFDALKGSLAHLIQATRGMNLLIFQSLSLSDDPLSVNLDWCPFYVHIHDLPYGQRTLDVVKHIGDCVGSWLSENDILRYISFFETVRIRINIHVKKPLKRALRICSESGEKSMIRFSYERLPNFCYLCALGAHVGRYSAYVCLESSSLSHSSDNSWRGANIFGGFSPVGGGARRSSPEPGPASTSSPVISEWLGGLDGSFGQQRLNMQAGNLQFSRTSGHLGEYMVKAPRAKSISVQDLLMGLPSTQPTVAQQSSVAQQPFVAHQPDSTFRQGPSTSKPPLALIDESSCGRTNPKCFSSPKSISRRTSSSCSLKSLAPLHDSIHGASLSLESQATSDQDLVYPVLIDVPVDAPPFRSQAMEVCLSGGGRFKRGRARGRTRGVCRGSREWRGTPGRKRTRPISFTSTSPQSLQKPHVLNLPSVYSDHTPVLLQFDSSMKTEHQQTRPPFRFEASWTRVPDCDQIVSDVWLGWSMEGSNYPALSSLARCSEALEIWSRATFKNVKKRIKWLEDRLWQLENQQMTPEVRSDLCNSRCELEGLLSDQTI
ncbi:hypothetical protein Salat_1737400 [Sesamum alatum]|uniref:Zinc knuckle CX2CX4HX4C domain-containing protein n=1 Tax=Sesamum alatum TaxID=300844 RepID=A0AAE2CKM1_9LAMI|nr:hypothetical protein Salat_1737400 [Sesamum alatum]